VQDADARARAADERARVTLAKIDVDANQGVAREYGINGIPAVKAFRNGQLVAEFVGALPPERVKAIPRRPDQPSLEDTIDDPEIAEALRARTKRVRCRRCSRASRR